MQQDLRLRADARLNYLTSLLWGDRPTFEEAERLRLPSYLEAVDKAIKDRDFEMELNSSAMQLRMTLI